MSKEIDKAASSSSASDSWPPEHPVRVDGGDGGGSARAELRRRDEPVLPGVAFDYWLKSTHSTHPTHFSSSSSSPPVQGAENYIVVTAVGLPVEVAKALVAKSAECVRGVELLNRLMASESAIGEICNRTGMPVELAQRTLGLKKENLLGRKAAITELLSLSSSSTLLIEVSGAKFSVG